MQTRDVEPIATTTFTYGDANWRDKLTAVNGVPITYDAIGNPLNDGTWTYTWQNGRQLKSMSKSGTTASFVYNADGLRTQKTVNGVVTNYTLHGKNVVHMTSGGNELHFFYDAQNRPAVVVYNGTAYAYVKNLQGDIVGILDNAGNWVVEYTYDAWGAPTSRTGSMADTLGVMNPFRYRSYVYDQETGLYYLNTRFYNPQYSRFITADKSLTSEHGRFGNNLFLYCTNSPVLTYDNEGAEYDVVVWGVQLEASAGFAILSAGGGIELIIFLDTPEAHAHGPVVAAYVYTEKNFNIADFSDQMDAIDEMANLLLNSADDLALDGTNAIKAICTAKLPQCLASASISGFAVTGSEEFKGAHDYLGDFESETLNVWKAKFSTAYAPSCRTYGVGYNLGSAGFGTSYSNSHYYLLKQWGGEKCPRCLLGEIHDR